MWVMTGTGARVVNNARHHQTPDQTLVTHRHTRTHRNTASSCARSLTRALHPRATHLTTHKRGHDAKLRVGRCGVVIAALVTETARRTPPSSLRHDFRIRKTVEAACTNHHSTPHSHERVHAIYASSATKDGLHRSMMAAPPSWRGAAQLCPASFWVTSQNSKRSNRDSRFVNDAWG